MKKKGILVVISGFSGVGKGTLMKELTTRYADTYALSVSATTRSPREGEENGKDYFFLSREAFERRIRGGELLEYAEYCGNYYGTPRHYVEGQLEAGKDVLLEIEIQGARQIRKNEPDAFLVFIMPPDAETLLKRLRGRGTESEEVIGQRMKQAVYEAQGIEEYDCILVNDDLEASTEELHRMIQLKKNETCRNLAQIEITRQEITKAAQKFGSGE